jgi:hypothetical protein
MAKSMTNLNAGYWTSSPKGYQTVGGGSAGTPVLNATGLGGSYLGAGQKAPEGGSRIRGGGDGGGGGYGGAAQTPFDYNMYNQSLQYAANQNNLNRDAVMGLYSPISSYYSGKLREDVWNPANMGLVQGLVEDRLAASRNTQQRKLQDAAAQRGGAMGINPNTYLNRSYQQDLSNQLRETKINAIEKNRSALESAMARELSLAQAQAQAYQAFPISPTPPTLGPAGSSAPDPYQQYVSTVQKGYAPVNREMWELSQNKGGGSINSFFNRI